MNRFEVYVKVGEFSFRVDDIYGEYDLAEASRIARVIYGQPADKITVVRA